MELQGGFYFSTQGEISPGLEFLAAAVTCSSSSLHNKNDYIIMDSWLS